MVVSRRGILSAGIAGGASLSLSSSRPAALAAATLSPLETIGLSSKAPADGKSNAAPAIQRLLAIGHSVNDQGLTPLQVGIICLPNSNWRCQPHIKGPTAELLVSKGARIDLQQATATWSPPKL